MRHDNGPENLAKAATQLLSMALQLAKADGAPDAIAEAERLHDKLALFPRLSISASHGCSELHVLLAFCDPNTGRPVVKLFEAQGAATKELH